jgi:hypothetical protein
MLSHDGLGTPEQTFGSRQSIYGEGSFESLCIVILALVIPFEIHTSRVVIYLYLHDACYKINSDALIYMF